MRGQTFCRSGRLPYEPLLEWSHGTSVWSVDLAYLLHRAGAAAVYYTTYFGARPEHAAERFYSNNFDADQLRVNERFAAAAAHGVRIEQRCV